MAPQFKIILVSPRGKGDNNPWVDTGLTVISGQRLSIAATGLVHLYAPGGTWAMRWAGPDGCGSYGPSGDCKLLSDTHGYAAARLIGRIGGTTNRIGGSNGTLIGIGRFYDQAAPATGRLELAVNDLDNYHYDNRGYFVAMVAIDAPGVPNHDASGCLGVDAVKALSNPVKLQSGDKTWSEIDLKVETPAGTLALNRSYAQSKQNHSDYQFMGLGWSHNHAYKLALVGASPNRTAEVSLPEGGSLKLSEASGNPGHFDAQPGSAAVLDYHSATNEYMLTAMDKSQYVFDGTTLQLKRRAWPTGESWTYSYSGEKLTEVADSAYDLDPGAGIVNRKLQFSYISNPGQYNDGQLWRVGDQTASGLSGGTPAGRYIELSYTPEKLNGNVVAGAKALLSSVRDARGSVWTYDYYGQTGGGVQTDGQQLNMLLKRLSPTVDTTGDAVADGSIALEELKYTDQTNLLESTSLAVNGGMELDSNWTAVGTVIANQRSKTQVDSGTYSRYVETDAVAEGIESDDWNLTPGRVYVITARVYPVSGRVKMQIKGTAVADESQAGTSAWETLRLIYSPSGEAQQRRLQFLLAAMPGSGNARFCVDTVTVARVKVIQQKRGDALLTTDLVFQANNTNLTTETVAGKTTSHYFANGVYAGPSNPAGELTAQAIGSDYRPATQADANGNQTQLEWGANGKLLNGVTDAAGHDTVFSYDGNDRLRSSVDTEGRKTFYLYDVTNRQPTLLLVEDSNNLAVNGGMEADSDWTNVGTPTLNQRTPAAQTSRYVRHIVASAAGQGIEGSSWNLDTSHTYTITARVYPVSGTVKMQVTGTTAFDKTSGGSGGWETLQAVYTPTSALTNRKLQFVASGGAAEFYVDSVSIFKSALELTVNGGMEAEGGWSSVGTPTTNERSTVRVDSGSYARRIVADAGGEGIQGNTWDMVNGETYLVTARVYPVSGVMRLRVPGITDSNPDFVEVREPKTQGTGTWQTLQMLLVEGSFSGRRLQFLSSGGAAEFYVDSVSILKAGVDVAVNGDMELDGDWTNVGTPTTNEQVVGADTGSYARRIKASATGQGMEGAAWNLAANRTYTVTARVYPVSGVVKMQVTGTTAFDKTSSLPGVWQTLRATYTPTNALTNSKLQFVASGGAAEFYVDSVSIAEIGVDLAINGSMEADSDWTNVGTPTTNQRSNTQVDSGSYARRVVASAAGQGIQGNTWDWAANRTYVVLARVYPVSGVVKMQVTGTTTFDKTSSGTGKWQTLRAVHTPVSGATGKRLQFVSSGGAAEFYVDSVHIVEVYKLLRWQDFRYDGKGRSLVEATVSPLDGSLQQQVERSYGVSGNANGLLESLTQVDPLNPGNNTTTTYIYDSAGRVVKTQLSSLFGTCQFSYTVYDTAGNVIATVCSRQNTTPPTTEAEAIAMYDPNDPDKSRVTTHQYDTLGRRVKTTVNAGASFAQTTLTFYDSLDRMARVIGNYLNQSGGAPEEPAL